MAACPRAYGFAVKLGTLTYDPSPDVRPAPTLFTEDPDFARYWQVFFQEAKPGLAGNCEVKPTPIGDFQGLAQGVGGPPGQGTLTLKGRFAPKLDPDLTFDLPSAQNVTLNTLLHTKPQDGATELVEPGPGESTFRLPMRLVRQAAADPGFDATFALSATGAPLSPRVNVKGVEDHYDFALRLDNVTIKPVDDCGTSRSEVILITSFGVYDVAQPVEIEVEGDWNCSNGSRYVGSN